MIIWLVSVNHVCHLIVTDVTQGWKMSSTIAGLHVQNCWKSTVGGWSALSRSLKLFIHSVSKTWLAKVTSMGHSMCHSHQHGAQLVVPCIYWIRLRTEITKVNQQSAYTFRSDGGPLLCQWSMYLPVAVNLWMWQGIQYWLNECGKGAMHLNLSWMLRQQQQQEEREGERFF